MMKPLYFSLCALLLTTSCSTFHSRPQIAYEDFSKKNISRDIAAIKIDKDIREKVKSIMAIADERNSSNEFAQYILSLDKEESKSQAYAALKSHFPYYNEQRSLKLRAILESMEAANINDDVAYAFRIDLISEGSDYGVMLKPNKVEVDYIFEHAPSEKNLPGLISIYMQGFKGADDTYRNDKEMMKYISSMSKEETFRASLLQYFSVEQNYFDYFIGWDGNKYKMPDVFDDLEIVKKLSEHNDLEFFKGLYDKVDKKEHQKITMFLLRELEANPKDQALNDIFISLFKEKKLFKDEYFAAHFVNSKVFKNIFPSVKDDLIKYSQSKGYNVDHYEMYRKAEGKITFESGYLNGKEVAPKKGKDYWVERMLRTDEVVKVAAQTNNLNCTEMLNRFWDK